MQMWDKPLTRENIAEFFHNYAPAAYRSAYRILGDSTRTENVMTESFLELYHRRNSDDNDDLVYLFSDILQKRVEALAAQFPVAESSHTASRLLDEFTENSILAEIYRRIDSTPYRLLEIFTSTAASKTGMHGDPVLDQVRKSGITLMLILQLVIAAVLIFVITFSSGNSVFGIDKLAPQSPALAELQIEDLLVPALNYLPLTITGQTAETSAESGIASETSSAAEQTSASDSSSLDTAASSTALDTTVASATRG